jgi:hypothetical protein
MRQHTPYAGNVFAARALCFSRRLPSTHPQSAATTVARILGREAMPFPVVPGAWIAWSYEGVTELEVVPRGLGYTRAAAGKEPEAAHTLADAAASGWHVAIGTTVSAAEVVRLAHAAGWPAQICDRAGFFELVEIWIDDACLVEVLDAPMLRQYRTAFSAQSWKAALQHVVKGERALSSNTAKN